MHLTPDELVDLAEGERPESSAPHLARCAACRAQLAEMRGTWAAAADADVPEPSPLFWDHFSQRVHDAVAADAANARLKPSRTFITSVFGARAFQVSIVAALALIVVVLVTSRTKAPGNSRPPAIADAGGRDVWIDAATAGAAARAPRAPVAGPPTRSR